jgi:hypothetical protein
VKQPLLADGGVEGAVAEGQGLGVAAEVACGNVPELPGPVVINPQPITYVTDPTAFWVGNVDKMALALGPAERADVIVDFSAYAGQTLILYNDAPAANPNGPESGQYRSVRGSSFETDFDQVESAVRHYLNPSNHRRDTGFRCAVTQPKTFAPYCQLAAYIPTGVIVSNGCQLPVTEVAGQYCAAGKSFATINLPADAVYEAGKDLKCEEAVVDGQRILTCAGPEAKEATNEVTVCNPTCSNSPDITGAVPTCDPGYTLDSAASSCNYSPIIGQVGVAGCPAGYVLEDRGGQQSCVIGTNANGLCPGGLYFDDLAGKCVPPTGLVEAPYGIDNPSLAVQSYSGCAAGFSYSETFQCCQAVSGGTYPGCSPGSTFNKDLGACSPGDIRLAGPGCVTLDVTTLQCSQPVDTCSPIINETRCINNPFCRWNEDAGTCDIRK